MGAIGGSLANNMAYNVLTKSVTYAATTAASGESMTMKGALGMIAGGVVGGLLPGYSAKTDGSFGNILRETVHESFRGAVSGGITGAVTAGLSGQNIFEGMVSGMGQGVKHGAIEAATMISIFGSATTPSKDVAKRLKKMDDDFSAVGNGMGNYKPIYRSGGILNVLQNAISYTRGFAFGRNLYVPGADNPAYENYVYLNETAHFYQNSAVGWAEVFSDALRVQLSMGMGCYYTPGNVEWAADQLFLIYGH
ncbi:MAG: hypothetical protein HYV28_08305 [Ignavibacteriales bacterium]|nr:hypothetical protein [Ignavibacteriales bacterium]